MSRARISIYREDRIWDLRCQGYDYDSIARIVNVSPSLTGVIRRIRRRPSVEVDPVRRGRRCNFLSDAQLEDIKLRYANGQRQGDIGKVYGLSNSAISHICTGRTYTEPEPGYNYDFTNRLLRRS
jgi:hypothetical protein